MSPAPPEFHDTSPAIHVQEADYLRLLGFPRGHAPEGRSRELVETTRRWFAEHGRPWMVARSAGGVDVSVNTLRMGDTVFSSPRLRARFAESEAHDAMLVAVSAGPECEEEAARCWQDGRPDEYFFLEAYGSAVVECLVALAAGRICAWADLNAIHVLPHYSPGYAGWPVSDQLALWTLIQGNDDRRLPGELSVMDSGMLRPKKSLLAVFGLTRRRLDVHAGPSLIPCATCVLPDCTFRRVPFRKSNPRPI